MSKATTLIILAALIWAGCRGSRSDEPPVHLNLNMDYQERYDPQEANPFFADNRSMRMPVPGTIARGMLREDVRFYEGRNQDGSYVPDVPLPTTRDLLLRGQARYDIFCAPCHGKAGDGQGIITTGGFGYTPAPTFHSDRLRDIQDGYIFEVITDGIRTMPSYSHQVPVADRWAITAYVRALQRSQYATEEDVPPSIRAEIRQRAGSGAPAEAAGQQPDAASPTNADTSVADTSAQAAGDNE